MHPNHLLFLLSSTLFLPLHCFYQSTATEHKTKSTMQEHEKIAALKPVASRPFSSFKSFSKLLKDAAGSPPITILEETNLIRPKTTRFRSLPSDLPTEITATISQDAGSGIILGEIEGDTEQVVSCDHLKTSHAVSVWKPMVSVKNRLSYDGYNWRKYGQKQVKGSEFPRSYYKCTHSSCCVKRKVETTIDGQIAEIVYSGEHNHPKPHPPMRPMPLTSTDVVGAGVHGTNNASAGSSNCFDEFGKMIELTVKKKSTRDKQSSNASSLAAYIDPTPTSETWTNYKLSRDAFSWRKYGQKVVKGTSFARSYYRCSAQRCNARKYVERDSPSGSSWVTTYEGRHSHGIPHPP